MSNVLIVDTDCVGLAFAWRCAQAGHSVRWFVKKKDGNNPETGKGFKGVEKVENWLSHAAWADLIFPTSNDEYIERLEKLSDEGFPVYGPSVKSTALEIKRAEGMAFLEKHGIQVPEYITFKSLKEAEQHQWKNEERYVLKPMGDNEDKALTYCSKSPADMVSKLQALQRKGVNLKGQVMLQKFIPGIEFAVSRWLGSNGFIGPYNENAEFKKLMPGDSGCNTGEMGSVLKYVNESSLGEEVMDPLEEALVKMGHLGDIDLNCIIDEKGKPYPLEFCARPGWPAFNIMLASHKGDPAQWMIDALDGRDTLKVSNDVAVGVVLACGDFPHSNKPMDEITGIPIYGVTEKNKKYLQPQSVMFNKLPDNQDGKIVEKEMWSTAGDYVLVATGTGPTVTKAKERVYKTVEELSVSDSFYRDDIGERLEKQLPQLNDYGYATEWEF